MKHFFSFLLLCCTSLPGLAAVRGLTFNTTTGGVIQSNIWPSNATAIATAIAPYVGTYVDPGAALLPAKNRFSVLSSNNVPWRPGGFGDSLGDDIISQWMADFGRVFGYNGGYLTVLTNSLVAPLTYTFSGGVQIPLPDTNWFALHFVLTNTPSDVTFDQSGGFVEADTFMFPMVHNTNGGTYKIQLQTNGGSFTDITGTLSALTANPTGVVVTVTTNRGWWKAKVVNVSGTNVCIGGGLWASNKGGISPSQMWSFGGTLADVTNVSTNITVPVLRSLGLTEFTWHALDPASLLTNALPIFCTTLAMAGCAPSNVDGTFVGVNQVTDNSTRYDLGNAFVQAYVTSQGYGYLDTQSFGDTNALVRRQWVTSGDCIHFNTLGIWYLAREVFRGGGVEQFLNAVITSGIGTRPALRIGPGYQQTTNIVEIVDYTGTTNLFYVTKDGFVAVGPRMTGTYVFDAFGNVILGKTNASGAVAFTRLNSSSSLANQILFDALNANTATITYERDSGRFTMNSGGEIWMMIDADNNQTGNGFYICKDAANGTNATKIAGFLENGGSFVNAGQSTTNAFLGGTMFYSLASFTNLNGTPGTLTNLGNYSIPAHTITNNGDRIVAEWGGVLANAQANTNEFQITYGGTTILDTGLQISSNTTFRARLTVARSGTSAQHCEGYFEWGPGGGVPFAFTNVNMETTIDAGVAQTVALKGASQRVGAHTNNLFTLEYKPGPK